MANMKTQPKYRRGGYKIMDRKCNNISIRMSDQYVMMLNELAQSAETTPPRFIRGLILEAYEQNKRPVQK